MTRPPRRLSIVAYNSVELAQLDYTSVEQCGAMWEQTTVTRMTQRNSTFVHDLPIDRGRTAMGGYLDLGSLAVDGRGNY